MEYQTLLKPPGTSPQYGTEGTQGGTQSGPRGLLGSRKHVTIQAAKARPACYGRDFSDLENATGKLRIMVTYPGRRNARKYALYAYKLRLICISVIYITAIYELIHLFSYEC